MESFNILKYIKKYQIFIVSISLLAGIGFYAFMVYKQNYTAAAVIKYTNGGAIEGLTPDGTEIDTSEIYSVEVMSSVFEKMGMDYSDYNLDKFRSRVVVEEVFTEEMAAIKEAKNEIGETLEEKPTEYMISFYANKKDSREPEQFAREVLDNMLDAYISLYGERHVNGEVSSNSISNLNERDYDYLEMIEIIDEAVKGTLENLLTKVGYNYYYRSSNSGYSFGDLYHEFESLSNIEINNIYAYILNNQVSKDKEKLLDKYRNRIAALLRGNEATEDKIQGIDNIIDSYVSMMRESGNTNINSDYILENVHGGVVQDEEGGTGSQAAGRTTSYDLLLEDYVENRESFESALIDVAYYKYIVAVFEGNEQTGTGIAVEIETTVRNEPEETELLPEGMVEPDGGNEVDVSGEPLAAAVPVAQTSALQPAIVQTAAGNLSNEAAMTEMDQMIDSLISQLEDLYQKLAVTNSEYNEYAGAANISVMTNVVVEEEYKVMLYAAMIVIIFACLFSVIAIILGRTMDIFEHYVYKDNKFDMQNREGCDHYMSTYQRILPENFSCITFKLSGIQEMNSKYGREKTDAMIGSFANMLKETFKLAENPFLAINGIGQFVVFVKNTSEEQAEAYVDLIKKTVIDYNKMAECQIRLEYGIAESQKSGIYRIKVLMMHSLRSTRPADLTA